MNASPSSAKAVFLAALQLPPDAWPEFVQSQCEADADLRRLVEGLLRAHQDAASRVSDTAAFSSALDPAGAGAVIGPYTLREVIGEGGMGVVYLAEQTVPVRRRVALKVIKPGMDSREVVARFEQERQALALMDHPHIARVFDGGATDEGRPYFVMELVRGLPITDYCDQAKLPAADRLKLFAQVCRAVQHAHQKGVIHRDLKPSNVLVTVIDGQPVPKVIDFGIAKATGGALTDKTVYTRFAQLVGTPLYMSPEQADLSGVDVDTRADVYSLGVMLYELLTGTTPFDPETVRRAGLDELRRIIREVEPARPSHRVSTLDAKAGTTVSNRRGLDQRQLGRLLRGDLDWIIMTALDKDRNRRYESAGAFAADVDRFLADQPVHARPPSATYRSRKFVRRNRVGLAVAAVLTLAGMMVVGAVGWGLRDAAARRAGAEQAATAALDESADHYRADRPEAAMASAKRAVDTLIGVAGAEPLLANARERVADLEMVSLLEKDWLDDTAVGWGPADLAEVAHGRFAEYGLDVSELPEHEAVGRIAVKLTAPDLVAGLDDWAVLRRVAHGPADPLAARLRAVATAADPDPWGRKVREAALDGTPDQIAALAAELPIESAAQTTVARLGLALMKVGRRAEAEALLRRAVQAHPDRVRPPVTLGGLLRKDRSELARVEALGFYRVALALRPQSVEMRNRIGLVLTDHLDRPAAGAEVFREVIRLRPDYAFARHNLVIALSKQGKHAEAVAAAREAVAVSPSATTYGCLAAELAKAGQRDEAREAHQAAAGREPQTANDYFARGNALSVLNRRAEAITAFREAVRLLPSYTLARFNLGSELARAGLIEQAIAEFHRVLQLEPDLGKAHSALGVQLRRLGRVDDAVAAHEDAIRCEPGNPEYRFNLGRTLYDLGLWEKAATAFQEAIRLKPDYVDALYSRGIVLIKAERMEEAIESYRQAIHYRPDHAMAHCNLGVVCRRRGEYDEALKHFQRGHELGSADPKWPYPSAKWLAEANRLVALRPRLAAILAGADVPAEAGDIVLTASVAKDRKQYARSAELYRTAFAQEPTLTDNVSSSKRYSAACSAALAGYGRGEDAAGLTAESRAQWRVQALGWLRAELSGWQHKLVGSTPATVGDAQNIIGQWQTDRDLAGVRDEAELAKLPDAERAEWAKFWAELASVLAKPRPDAGK